MFNITINSKITLQKNTIQILEKDPKINNNYSIIKKIENNEILGEASNYLNQNSFLAYFDNTVDNNIYYILINIDITYSSINLNIDYLESLYTTDNNDDFKRSCLFDINDNLIPISNKNKGIYDVQINFPIPTEVNVYIFKKNG